MSNAGEKFQCTMNCSGVGMGAILDEDCGDCVPVRTAPKLVLALPDHDQRQIVIASDEVIDGERLVCVAIKEQPADAPGEALPKWIDDQKGKDPSTDDLIEEIIRLRGLCRQIAAVESEEVKQLRATVDKRQHDVLREALACIEYYESKQLADSVRAILDRHGQQIGAYRPPVHVTLAGIHNASIYFDWSREGTGFGQLSINKRTDGTVTCMNECMGREFIRNALHAAMDALVDAAVLEER